MAVKGNASSNSTGFMTSIMQKARALSEDEDPIVVIETESK
jgi:hypothetical protein